jgi:hypothetical protein
LDAVYEFKELKIPIICDDPDTDPDGIIVIKDDVVTALLIPLPSPTQAYPLCSDAVKDPVTDNDPEIDDEPVIKAPPWSTMRPFLTLNSFGIFSYYFHFQ